MTITYSLKTPVSHGAVTFKDLEFREPTVGDLVLASSFKEGVAQSVALLATISDVPLPAFNKISGKEFAAIVAATAGILGNDELDPTGD